MASPRPLSSSDDSSSDNDMEAPPTSSQASNETPVTGESKKEVYLRAVKLTKKAYEEWMYEERGHGQDPRNGTDESVSELNQTGGQQRGGRVAVQAPTKGEAPKPPPTVKGRKTSNFRKEAEEVFTICSRNIARAVGIIQDRTGVKRISDDQKAREMELHNTGELKSKVPNDFPHEQELELLVKPETLRTGGWEAPLQVYTGSVPIQDGNVLDQVKALSEKMDALDSKLDLMLSILHLHSVAHVSAIKAANETRLLCLAEAKEKDAVHMQLQLSLRAITLASDGDLNGLPFKTLPEMDKFFEVPEKIQKLAFFILSYFPWAKGFPRALLNTVLDKKLQYMVFWSPETYHKT